MNILFVAPLAFEHDGYGNASRGILAVLSQMCEDNLINAQVDFVDTAKKEEKFTTLDGQERILDDSILMIRDAKKIITVEEHQLSGGFGSWVLEEINELYLLGEINIYPKVRRIGIPNKFQNCAGTQEYLREMAGIML